MRIAAVGFVLCAATAVAAQEGAGAKPEKTATRKTALPSPLQRGLDFLVSAQREDGHFAPNRFGRPFRRGITGICVLALLATGKEPYLHAARRGLAFLASHGKIVHMYSHGYAALALCEGAVRWPKGFSHAAKKAVRRILDSQNRNGSWGYAPSPRSSRTESCMAALMLFVLHAADQAGVKVPQPAVEKAVAFLHRQYDPRRRMFKNEIMEFPSHSYGATAMALGALERGGEQDSDIVSGALAWLGKQSVEKSTRNLRGTPFSGYARGRYHFELVAHGIALRLARDPEILSPWLRRVRARVASQIGEEGAFDGWFGKAYGTGLMCLLLQLDQEPALTWLARG